jgi:apolipoprotein N-acyltransferase
MNLPPLASLLLRILVTAASAVLLAFIAPPVNLHAIHWLAYVPMMLILRVPDRPRRVRAWVRDSDTWLAIMYGVLAQSAIFFWIVETITRFTDIPTIAALGILGLFSVVFGAPYILLWWLYAPLRRAFGPWWVLAFPAALVVLEWLGSFIILFPYHQGIAHYRVPSTFQLVSVTGVWGVSWLVMFVNACFAAVILAFRDGKGIPWAWLGAAAGLWGIVNLWGIWRYNAVEATLTESKVLRVLQVQDDIDMLDRMERYPCETWNYWYGATARLQRGQADLAVWSEGASVYALNMARKPRKYRDAPCEDIDDPAGRLGDLAARLDLELLVGSSAYETVQLPDGRPQRRSFNSVYHVRRDGSLTRYDKIVPLPFGEYIPLSDTFPFLRDLIEGPGNFQAGVEPVVFAGEDARYATPICYEAILPAVCRSFPDPDLLVNGSLDTWFGNTSAPHQHAMLAAARSTELGIPLFRNAYTGVSMVVEPHGRIVHETEPYREVARVVPVRLGKVPTLYRTLTPWGLQDWFVLVCGLGLAVGRFGIPWMRRT